MDRLQPIRFRSVGLPLTLVVAALAISHGCSARSTPADELLIASPHRDEIRDEIERAFRAWYGRETSRDVRPIWLDLGGSSNIQKYLADRLAKGPSAGVDIFFGGGSDPFESLKRQGNLVAYKLPEQILSRVQPELHGVPIYDPDHTWYGVVLSSFGIRYNYDVLRRVGLPQPKTWEDLGATEYWGNGSGWVGAADPRHSSSVHVIYENVLQAYGWEKGFAVLARSAANAREFTRESASVPRQVQIGDVACAPVIDLYAYSLIAREGRDRIGFVLPEGLTVITPDAAAIVRGAPNPAVAEAFMRFLLFEDGQKIWQLRRGMPGGPTRYDLGRPSVLPHLYDLPAEQLAVTVNPFETKAALRYDGKLASRRWNVLNDLIGATLIDSQTELQHAWAAALNVRDNSALVEQLTRPPCDADDLLSLADVMRQSPRERNRTIASWMSDARKRYRAVAEAATRRNSS
jgi:ABC-type Fe3+ transport system substrate-binding protein